MTVPGMLQAGALLDEYLAVLAHRHRGTFFGRAALRGGGRGDPLAAQLRLGDTGLPGESAWREKRDRRSRAWRMEEGALEREQRAGAGIGRLALGDMVAYWPVRCVGTRGMRM